MMSAEGDMVVVMADDVLEQVRRALEGRRKLLAIAEKYGDADAVIRHSEVIDELGDILYVFKE